MRARPVPIAPRERAGEDIPQREIARMLYFLGLPPYAYGTGDQKSFPEKMLFGIEVAT